MDVQSHTKNEYQKANDTCFFVRYVILYYVNLLNLAPGTKFWRFHFANTEQLGAQEATKFIKDLPMHHSILPINLRIQILYA